MLGPDGFFGHLWQRGDEPGESSAINLAGVTNLDVARSSAGSLNGDVVGNLRDGHRLIPIVARPRGAERAHHSDVQNCT